MMKQQVVRTRYKGHILRTPSSDCKMHTKVMSTKIQCIKYLFVTPSEKLPAGNHPRQKLDIKNRQQVNFDNKLQAKSWEKYEKKKRFEWCDPRTNAEELTVILKYRRTEPAVQNQQSNSRLPQFQTKPFYISLAIHSTTLHLDTPVQ